MREKFGSYRVWTQLIERETSKVKFSKPGIYENNTLVAFVPRCACASHCVKTMNKSRTFPQSPCKSHGVVHKHFSPSQPLIGMSQVLVNGCEGDYINITN